MAMFTSNRWSKVKCWSSFVFNMYVLITCCMADNMYVCMQRGLLVSQSEMLLWGDVDFHLTHEVEVLIVVSHSMQWLITRLIVLDTRIPKYVSMSLSKFESLLHCWNLNWRLITEMTHPSRLSIQMWCLWIVKPRMWRAWCRTGGVIIKGLGSNVHSVQILIILPWPHSTGAHRLHGIVLTFATASPSCCFKYIPSSFL